MLCLCPQVEQSVDVFFGSTLAYGIPAFQALYSSIWWRALHLCSDIFFENLLERSIPFTPRSSEAMPSCEETRACARRKSACLALSFSRLCTLAWAVRFLIREREPLCARESLRCTLLACPSSTVRAGMVPPQEVTTRKESPLSIPTELVACPANRASVAGSAGSDPAAGPQVRQSRDHDQRTTSRGGRPGSARTLGR